MKEQIINGINYRLNEETKTAEVIRKSGGYEGDINIPEIVEFNGVSYRVTSIRSCAFNGSSALVSITIPNSVTSIGNEAFYGCASLTSINVESGNSVYDSRENCDAIIETDSNTLILGCQNTIIPDGIINIGEGAFYECSNLTSITIPNSVTKIGHWSFKGCSNLISITIPNSVKKIGDSAFFGCTSLTSISFQGTIAQWKEIALDENWKEKVPANVVHCTDGDVEI